MRWRRPTGMRFVAMAAAVCVLAVAVVVGARAVVSAPDDGGGTMPDTTSVAVTAEDLAAVSGARVFFGHQSVGLNILDGVRALYAAQRTPPPGIEESRAPLTAPAFIQHVGIGENEKPSLKIQDFDAALRAGVGAGVDVAMMKFCYIDITAGTDVDALFAEYRRTIADLERDFPAVTFVKVTVPLTTDPGTLSRWKAKLGGSGRLSRAENVARERLNALIRKEYEGEHLFDLAAVESTAADGSRVTGEDDGRRYYALDPRYASDAGHLNALGARIVGAAWIKAVAAATRR